MVVIIGRIRALVSGRGLPAPGGASAALAGKLDRVAFLAALAVLAVWSACLWVLSGRAFGCCWSGMVEVAAMELAAAAAVLNLPNAVWRLVFSRARRVLFGRVAAGQLSKAALARWEARGRRRLLAAACVFCAAGGLASWASISAASAAMRRLAEMFFFPPWIWTWVRLLLSGLVMLPLAAAGAGLVLVGSRLRRYGRTDPYRYVHRDLAWAASGGLGAAAALWWAGTNLRGVAVVCAVALVGIASAAGARRSNHPRPHGRDKPSAGPKPPEGQRALNLCLWAMFAWVLALQCRALRDAAGADWAATWLWAAATAAALSLVTRRVDRRVRVGQRAEALAAALGAWVVAGLQLALLALAGARARGAWLWVVVAAAGQLAFAGLWAVVLARRRRVFAGHGFAGRAWPADAAAGLAIGLLAALAMLSSRISPAMLTATFLLVLAGVVATGGKLVGRGLTRLRWLGLSAAGASAAWLVLAGLAPAVRASLGQNVAVGASFTAVQAADGSVYVLPRGVSVREDAAVAVVARRLVDSHPGRWWLISAGPTDVRVAVGAAGAQQYSPVAQPSSTGPSSASGPASRPARPLLLRWGVLSPACHRLPIWRGHRTKVDGRGLARSATIRTPPLDGIYLNGLRAGHPDAWCLYNREALAEWLGRLGPGGLLILRTASSGRDFNELLAVAETFRSAAAGGWAAAEVTHERVELLLAVQAPGPESTDELGGLLARTSADLPAEVFALQELTPPTVRASALTISSPVARGDCGMKAADFARWLRRRGGENPSP